MYWCVNEKKNNNNNKLNITLNKKKISNQPRLRMDALEYVCTAKIYVEIFKNKKVGAITRRQNKNIYIYKYKYIFSVVRERSGE